MNYILSHTFDTSREVDPYAIILLNQPINEPVFDAVSKDASMILCADGGANRLYDLSQRQGGQDVLPTAVIGDFDSILPKVRAHYASLSTPIIEDPDQYSTDFTKCLKYIRSKSDSPTSVVVFGGLDGRVDQGLSQLHHLFLALEDQRLLNAEAQIFLLSSHSLSFPLRKGRSIIKLHSSTIFFGANVGIIPIIGPAVISTQGFEWDVKDWPTRMGGQVSTSNHWRWGDGKGSEEVIVETDQEVLFTVELDERLCSGYLSQLYLTHPRNFLWGVA